MQKEKGKEKIKKEKSQTLTALSGQMKTNLKK